MCIFILVYFESLSSTTQETFQLKIFHVQTLFIDIKINLLHNGNNVMRYISIYKSSIYKIFHVQTLSIDIKINLLHSGNNVMIYISIYISIYIDIYNIYISFSNIVNNIINYICLVST